MNGYVSLREALYKHHSLYYNSRDINLPSSVQAFLSSASPLCFMQADRSAEPGGRAAAAVKRWAAVLSDHSYPSSKSSLQANHMELSRPTPRSTSSTQQPHTRVTGESSSVCCDSGFTCLMGGVEI